MSKDNNLFIENCLIIINEDGTVTKVPRVLQERNHRNAFFRLNKENPSALTYFPGKNFIIVMDMNLQIM